MTARPLLCSLTAVVALSACATASATTPVRFKQARFKATVEGVQTTKWTADHPSTSRCDSAFHGKGSERVTFASSRAVKVKALSVLGGPPLFAGSPGLPAGQPDLPTRGWVQRTGTLERAPVVPECAVGDGGGPDGAPPASDCGRKRIPSLLLRLGYDPAGHKRIVLQSQPVATPRFSNCPNMGDVWPVILSRDRRHGSAGVALPARDLFDRHQGKMILLGKGTVSGGDDGIHYTTHVEWTLTLTRLRGGT